MTDSRPFVDPGGLVAFWRDQYLRSYVADGGSAVKWLSGREGSGKTAVLEEMRRVAEAEGYLTACVSARAVQIGRFDELYRAILADLSLEGIARLFAAEAAKRLGAVDFTPGVDGDLEAYLLLKGRPPAAVAADLAGALDFLYADRNIASPVATALRHIAAAALRPFVDPEVHRETASTWITGGKVSATQRRRAGIGMTLDRYGAREILRSLLHANRLVGGKGLLVAIDDIDALLGGDAAVRYTPLRRDDAFEAMRELIDEGAGMPGLFTLFAGRPEIYADERAGLGSYPALAMRVAPEVRSQRPNPYEDLQDLDAIWHQDWPRWRERLAEAYGATQGDAIESKALFAMGPVSPVKILVEAIRTKEGGVGGA